MNHIISGLLAASLLLAPAFAHASFNDAAANARQQVNSLSQQQLDSLNARLFTDAFIAAKIVGFDRSEIDQLKADMRALKEENAQLRAQLSSRPAAPVGFAPSDNQNSRIAALEAKFEALQSTLAQVVTMLTLVLGRLQ